MVRNIIKYVGIALVIVGVLLVMKNLFAKEDTNWNEDVKEKYYSAKIKLLDKDTNDYLEGAKLILKNQNGDIVKEWISTNKTYTVKDLSNGEYTLIQDSAIENYHQNNEGVIFKIKDSNETVIMYNIKMTEEEIKEANTSKDEVNVDNTASSKSILVLILATILTSIGCNLIYKVKKSY